MRPSQKDGSPLNPERESESEQLREVASDVFPQMIQDSTMFDLFDAELETQCKVLNSGIIELERMPNDQKLLESLMRAAHSIKGAARVVSLNPVVRLAHAMEDLFVAAQNGKTEIHVDQINQLLRGVDLFAHLSKVKINEVNVWLKEQLHDIEALIQAISSLDPLSKIELKEDIQQFNKEKTSTLQAPLAMKIAAKNGSKKNEPLKNRQTSITQDRFLRITAQNLNRLMGLAGESLVESRWLAPFGESLQSFKNNLKGVSHTLDLLRDNLKSEKLNVIAQNSLNDLHHQLNDIHFYLSERLGELDSFISRHESLSDRLYQAVISSRMRPFADGVEAFPRMVRDVAHQLGKQVRFEIDGKATPVDRDILERLEAPLSHLLRNAIDHGIERPEERLVAGKHAEGLIKLEANHRGGILEIKVSDDGRGIDIEQLRLKIVEKKLVSREMAEHLSTNELLDFLFLPGFSTSASLTEISGRGVGLDVVKSTVQEVGGEVHTFFKPGNGMSFHLKLPLTLAVLRSLLVEISGEVYALPLAAIDKTFFVNRESIEISEDRQFFHYEDQRICLIPAWEVLELSEPQFTLTHLPVIVLSDRFKSYGLVVDRLIGEKELVVLELDSRLGKIPDISAGALMEEGSPILIIDSEDIVCSIDHLLSGGRRADVSYTSEDQTVQTRKRILVVDDSITVRELECRLLQNQGYDVESAVNGIDGWNAVRIGQFDLVITDIDMPRMSGIELLEAIRKDAKLQHLPVMIVTYKEREGDREKGLKAGANAYLTKSSFHDGTLLEAINALMRNP
jgi:two-component system sensor histidine kinase and response regulator WspE